MYHSFKSIHIPVYVPVYQYRIDILTTADFKWGFKSIYIPYINVTQQIKQTAEFKQGFWLVLLMIACWTSMF